MNRWRFRRFRGRRRLMMSTDSRAQIVMQAIASI
jgi:hypothetical protein